jgi:hypothetical protein
MKENDDEIAKYVVIFCLADSSTGFFVIWVYGLCENCPPE